MESPILIDLEARERRLYDRLRANVSEVRAGEPSNLRDLLLLLPDMTVLLFRLMRDERVPVGSKLIAMAGLAYILSPIDLVPEVFLGPIGLVDDLLVVATALSRLLNYVHPDIVRSHWSGQGDALDALQRITVWTEEQVAGRVRGIVNWMLGARSHP